MPFVSKEHRATPDMNAPGDRCYVEYKKIMDAWRASPRWTTVDLLYEKIRACAGGVATIEDDDTQRARELAFMVFFNLHVMPYETKKRKENGDV